MRRSIYILSLFLTVVVFLFIILRILGFILWVNNAPLDKWIALIGLLAVPTFVYIYLKNKEVTLRKIQKIIGFITIVHVGWLWWAMMQYPSYAFVGSNNINSTPYIFHENEISNSLHNKESKSEYTLFSQVNSYLFAKDSVVEANRGIVPSIQLRGAKFTTISNSVYLETKSGIIFIR